MILGSVEDEKCFFTLSFTKFFFEKQVRNIFGFGRVNVCTKFLYNIKLSIYCCDQSMDTKKSLKNNRAIVFLQ